MVLLHIPISVSSFWKFYRFRESCIVTTHLGTIKHSSPLLLNLIKIRNEWGVGECMDIFSSNWCFQWVFTCSKWTLVLISGPLGSLQHLTFGTSFLSWNFWRYYGCLPQLTVDNNDWGMSKNFACGTYSHPDANHFGGCCLLYCYCYKFLCSLQDAIPSWL